MVVEFQKCGFKSIFHFVYDGFQILQSEMSLTFRETK
jgi:hypothetical protein